MLAEFPHSTILAGGTDLMVEVNLSHLRPEVVLLTSRLEEIQQVENGFIGAGVTFAQLESSPHPALAQLSRTVGSPQIRAAATLGGNLGTASPAGDSIPFLVAADAGIVLGSTQGQRTVSWSEFFVGPKQTSRRKDELILGVELGVLSPRQAFSKIGVRQAMVIATASCCVLRHPDGPTQVAVGAVGPTVLRMRDAEQLVSQTATPSDEVLDEFQRQVSDSTQPITDHRSTANYRRQAVGLIARRSLERCLA